MKFFSNLLFSFCIITLLGIFLSSCGSEDECTSTCEVNETQLEDCSCIPNSGSSDLVTISDNITSDVTWSSDRVILLNSRIVVESGVTLTIDPGTIIKANAGAGTNAAALLIARGARIMAEGTAASPIIFTSIADQIQPGDLESPNLDPTINGLWGGVLILGNAPISADAESVQIDGIPPSDQNGLYGGTMSDDNSGVLRYVSIRHGGADIGEGNEINGLTLGGVGSGTTIDHIEVVSNVDDGIEFFGGTVNASDLIVWNQGDDAFDGDQAYSGTVDNFVNIAGPSSDHSLEFDGPEGATNGSYTFTNGTCRGYNEGGTGGGEYADFRSNLMCTLSNVYFFNYSEDSDFELDNDGVAANYLNGAITTSGLEFNVSHLSAGNMTCNDIMQDNSDAGTAFTQIDPGCSIVTIPTVGADTSEFEGWSLSSITGALDF